MKKIGKNLFPNTVGNVTNFNQNKQQNNADDIAHSLFLLPICRLRCEIGEHSAENSAYQLTGTVYYPEIRVEKA